MYVPDQTDYTSLIKQYLKYPASSIIRKNGIEASDLMTDAQDKYDIVSLKRRLRADYKVESKQFRRDIDVEIKSYHKTSKNIALEILQILTIAENGDGYYIIKRPEFEYCFSVFQFLKIQRPIYYGIKKKDNYVRETKDYINGQLESKWGWKDIEWKERNVPGASGDPTLLLDSYTFTKQYGKGYKYIDEWTWR